MLTVFRPFPNSVLLSPARALSIGEDPKPVRRLHHLAAAWELGLSIERQAADV